MAKLLNDWWLENEIASPPTAEHPLNYYSLDLNSELQVVLEDYATCLNSTLITVGTSFEGWDIAPLPLENNPDWHKVVYANGIGYVAISSGEGLSITSIMTSPDGVVWTEQTIPNMLFLSDIIYAESEGLLVVTMDTTGGNNLLTSPDGVNWTASSTGTIAGGTPNLKRIHWSEEQQLYVILGYFTAWIASSPDLITWTEGTTTGPYIGSPNCVTYAPALDLWCVVDYYGIVYTSPDALVWSWQQLGGGSWNSAWANIAWAESLGMFVCQGEAHSDGTQPEMFMSSPDGITWTIRPLNIPLVAHPIEVPILNTFLPAIQVKWDSYTSKFYALTAGDDNGNFTGQTLIAPSMYLLTSVDGINWVIDGTVPGTHEYPYPIFTLTAKWLDIAFKDADNRVMINITSSTYSTPV